MTDALIASLRRAVEAAPDDLPLRLHLAELLMDGGQGDDAVTHLATVLAAEPGNEQARELMARAVTGAAATGFDWRRAEAELDAVVPPMFVDERSEDSGEAAFDVEQSSVTLVDVGGLTEVKAQLEAAFLVPMRNPKLRELYGKSLKGGLLLYGPPGCGKTFLGRAVAGELGAGFMSVSLAEGGKPCRPWPAHRGPRGGGRLPRRHAGLGVRPVPARRVRAGTGELR